MKAVRVLFVAILMVFVTGCEPAEYDRLPAAPVRIEFGNAAMWGIYGVRAYPDHREYIKEEHKPKGFTYVANSYTGFGGVMLVCDPVNIVHAYDLACPVERSTKVRIDFDSDDLVLRCKNCGSTYDVSTGAPLSGRAFENKYFLQSYAVYFSPVGGVLVTR